MTVYAILILAFVGALWLYNHQRQTRLNADLGQHRLAELLTAAASGGGANPQQIRDHLSQISKGSADRRVRLSHAVLLVRSEAAPDLYAKVLELSRQLA